MQLLSAFCRLTLELSRAERGDWEPVLRGCLQVSTKPRDGVGLNEWLGAKEAGEREAIANMPKTEARMPERATRTLRRLSPKRPNLGQGC